MANVYEVKMISRGNNSPSVNLGQNNLDMLCVMLHARRTESDIKDTLVISQSKLKEYYELLLQEGLIKKVEQGYLPTFPVILQENGEDLYRQCTELGGEIAALIEKNLTFIREQTYRIDAFQSFAFEDISLFILSDVLLDCIQIDHVESDFLQKDRPDRNGKQYYLAIMEKDANDPLEAYGIYGNHYEKWSDVGYCMYGNDRYGGLNLVTLTKEKAFELFGALSDKADYKGILLQHILHVAEGKMELEPTWVSGFEKLNLVANGKVSIPVLSTKEFESLNSIADLIKEELILILDNYRSKLNACYLKSEYANETTFEEWFIWYYHFLYSFVTEDLIRKKIIHKPLNGLFSCIIY
ncbi:hypothetical protein E0485_13285 [Paenibacillus albiflavus]|uniref:Uncharacterized protein n=1 Tax=Paenibacillus albiflavus TaxID=2545760 RepID=A0A4V2WNS1_9BACL|nr:hypothetical protein [Paenibacillus albiflavus]TCZ76562.1 hypothetical protein E0485_13285 [Paenibacillus albiflavus]